MEGTNDINSIFWIGTFIMLFLAFGLLYMAAFYQRHFAKMRQKETETLLKTALDSEKEERQRIAKDLHDSVQGDLSAVRNYVALFTKKTTDLETKDLLGVIASALEQTAENTRLISYKLMPPLLETSGFIAAVLEYFDRLTQSSGKSFTVNASISESFISTAVAYELFRIVEELTQNMLKYGRISECNLSINKIELEIYIEIKDDGIPFNFKTSYSESKGSGLHNIKSRLASINAEMVQGEAVIGNHFVIRLKQFQ